MLYVTDAATGQGQRGNRSMGYDGLNRLTSASSPMFGTASYTYDVLDNLTHVAVTGGSQPRDQAYVYDTSNRLTNITSGGATVVGLGYDVQGNLANKSGVAYTFDYGNRLMGVGSLEGYRYDVAGRRVLGWSPTTGSILSVYGHDGVLRFQQNQRNATNIDYVYLGGSLVATYSYPYATGVGTVKYQHTDALGSPVAVTDSNKTVLQRSEYEPYGYLLNRPMEDGPGYTGHVTDAATGLVYMQQRYYDPVIGRFLSRDEVTAYEKPLTNFNAYVYALNNPYRFTDPDGRDSASCYGDGGCGGNNSFYASREKLEGLAGTIPGVDLGLCARNGCGAGGWVLAGLGVVPGEGKAAQVGIRVTRASLNRVKSLIRALSKAEAKAKPLTQGKVEKLERIVEKVGGTLRNDGDSGVKGSSAGTPHVQTEGLGNKTDSRHIWTEPDVKLKDEK